MPARPFTLRHAIRVVFAMGWSDFVLKYRGSILGYVWSLALPLVKFGVILFVFGPYVEDSIPMYRLYLFLGIIIWEHFSVTTTACMGMLFDKSAIIQRLPFPRILLIFAVGWTNFIVFLTHLIVFLFYAYWIGWQPHIEALYSLVTLAEMTFVALGIGMMLASWCLKFKDIQHLWTVVLQILFWVTPIMFPYTLQKTAFETVTNVGAIGTYSAGSALKLFIEIQPLSVLMLDARRAILYADLWGMPTFVHTIGVLMISFVIFLIGIVMFQKRQKYFTEEY